MSSINGTSNVFQVGHSSVAPVQLTGMAAMAATVMTYGEELNTLMGESLSRRQEEQRLAHENSAIARLPFPAGDDKGPAYLPADQVPPNLPDGLAEPAGSVVNQNGKPKIVDVKNPDSDTMKALDLTEDKLPATVTLDGGAKVTVTQDGHMILDPATADAFTALNKKVYPSGNNTFTKGEDAFMVDRTKADAKTQENQDVLGADQQQDQLNQLAIQQLITSSNQLVEAVSNTIKKAAEGLENTISNCK